MPARFMLFPGLFFVTALAFTLAMPAQGRSGVNVSGNPAGLRCVECCCAAAQ